jgi:excisionase family DNA binding protein
MQENTLWRMAVNMSLSIHEVSQKLGVSIGTVREWERKDKIIPFRTPGGHRRYKEDDVRKLMVRGVFELKDVVILIQIPRWRIRNELKETLQLSKGDTGIIINILGPQYDSVQDKMISPFLYRINWLICKDPLSIGRESSVESEDIMVEK